MRTAHKNCFESTEDNGKEVFKFCKAVGTS
nr:MAG TPA: Chromosome region maintenance protein [Caudoviricetes sp.]